MDLMRFRFDLFGIPFGANSLGLHLALICFGFSLSKAFVFHMYTGIEYCGKVGVIFVSSRLFRRLGGEISSWTFRCGGFGGTVSAETFRRGRFGDVKMSCSEATHCPVRKRHIVFGGNGRIADLFCKVLQTRK